LISIAELHRELSVHLGAGDASATSASVALISQGAPQLGFRFTNA
jgi:hypothetical protein